MKKILFISIGLLFLLQACYDEYKLDHEFSTTYFARQYPLRTLVDEGDDLTFEIGVVLGGKYENTVNEVVDFVIEDTLLNSYPDLVKLPESYYTLEEDEIIIPSGEFKGAVTVTLDKEKFMSDELAVGKNYALPLQIISASTDSIHEEKDYTIIVLRYYNEYHGWYYVKGVDSKLDESGNVVDSEIYSDSDLTENRSSAVVTVAKDTVLVPHVGRYYTSGQGYSMLMGVNDGSASLIGNTGDVSEVSGSGTYDPTEKIFTLQYSYNDADGAPHQVKDTLIFRNTELRIEEWQ